ncbi:MarR family winged helix-turn-helix transcriptional regulator [Mariniplasma anaerobium]|uniref:MarR family transcriptional regulator n=1 Tax=Mariniplasma anaerobium TaxID=2735436 RepID=A0A7U9XVG9_9MOLU|nr:winged helix DNA-binding protein [Mariniplasma anaerobium]BCR35547.1 MarR family transcriptional regulator [Mariniplasma anaerobium]
MKKDYQTLQQLDRALKIFRRSGIYDRVNTKLSDADIMVLFCVAFCDINQKVKLTDIAKTLKVTLPAVTHKVNDLVDKSYLEKVPSAKDLRVIFIRLTENGKKYVESIRDDYYKPIEQLAIHLGEEDSKNLLRIMNKISEIGKIKI